MLIKLSVSNFLSFNDEIDLSMITSSKIQTSQEHKMEIGGASILKHAVVYGANASGKSNLIEVLSFMKSSICDNMPRNSSSMFCRTQKENENKPSVFETTFAIGNKVYAYGFSSILSQRIISEEWLYQLNKNGSSKNVFHREEGKKPVIGIKLAKNDQVRMETYLGDFNETSNLLFLTFMNNGKNYSQGTKLSIFKDVYNWFYEGVEIFKADVPITDFRYYYDEASLSFINKLITTFDTGISCINIEEISYEEVSKEISKDILVNIVTDILKKTNESGNQEIKVSLRSRKSFFNIECSKDGTILFTTIKLEHINSQYHFDFKEESDGTRRLLDLLDMLLEKKENKIYIVDELERSLHPKLTYQFLQLFHQQNFSKRTQLIFTTHESSIMDADLFRRDEIWFVERDKNNCSKIYSLDRFKERYDTFLSKAYLSGRYGAIPIFKDFENRQV
ncbi:AAA family ATPase [Tannockella kyphosi]|uniref:AAA family ATPase n=1 Tax=Tannockella kyphosi TaxID=2899121 RepID=UPI00201112B0|nr:ATP-binding protein [Tannockella kyphosi]